MTDLELYQQYKEKLEKWQRKISEAKGALKPLTARMSEELGCSSIEEAETKLAYLKQLKARIDKKVMKALNSLEENHGDKLR